MQIKRTDLKIGRVLHEDDTFLTLEVVKDENRKLRLEDGDRFLTLLFLRKDEDEEGAMEVWTPWEEET